MRRLEDIKESVLRLPEEEQEELKRWLLERDWDKWDEEIKRDSEEGRLDFLEEEARREKRGNLLKPF